MVIAQSAPRTERNLIVRQRDKGVERASRDPERHSGKPRRVELEAAEAIEQTLLAPSFVVARRRMSLRHKEVLDREAVAAGSRTPGENAAGCAEDLAGRGGLEIGRGHRAARHLVEAPRRAGVVLATS